jgi:uncharacterized membrane protein YvbJ
MSIADFKLFLGKQLKAGSVILAVIFPIVLALGQFNLIAIDYMRFLNQILIGAEVILVIYKIIFDEFLKSKKKLRELNNALNEGDSEKAKELVDSNRISESVKQGVAITKEIINTVKSKQKSTHENLPEQNLPERLTEARAEAYKEIVKDAQQKERILFPQEKTKTSG